MPIQGSDPRARVRRRTPAHGPRCGLSTRSRAAEAPPGRSAARASRCASAPPQDERARPAAMRTRELSTRRGTTGGRRRCAPRRRSPRCACSTRNGRRARPESASVTSIVAASGGRACRGTEDDLGMAGVGRAGRRQRDERRPVGPSVHARSDAAGVPLQRPPRRSRGIVAGSRRPSSVCAAQESTPARSGQHASPRPRRRPARAGRRTTAPRRLRLVEPAGVLADDQLADADRGVRRVEERRAGVAQMRRDLGDRGRLGRQLVPAAAQRRRSLAAAVLQQPADPPVVHADARSPITAGSERGADGPARELVGPVELLPRAVPGSRGSPARSRCPTPRSPRGGSGRARGTKLVHSPHASHGGRRPYQAAPGYPQRSETTTMYRAPNRCARSIGALSIDGQSTGAVADAMVGRHSLGEPVQEADPAVRRPRAGEVDRDGGCRNRAGSRLGAPGAGRRQEHGDEHEAGGQAGPALDIHAASRAVTSSPQLAVRACARIVVRRGRARKDRATRSDPGVADRFAADGRAHAGRDRRSRTRGAVPRPSAAARGHRRRRARGPQPRARGGAHPRRRAGAGHDRRAARRRPRRAPGPRGPRARRAAPHVRRRAAPHRLRDADRAGRSRSTGRPRWSRT